MRASNTNRHKHCHPKMELVLGSAPFTRPIDKHEHVKKQKYSIYHRDSPLKSWTGRSVLPRLKTVLQTAGSLSSSYPLSQSMPSTSLPQTSQPSCGSRAKSSIRGA